MNETNQTNQTNQINTIIHLGAGQCSELDEYLARQPKRLLLVEADPNLADALRRRSAGLPQVEVSCAAVAGRPGPAVFHRYNLPDAGSLHAATGLLQLFPGLKTLDRLPVDAVSPAALLEPLQLQPEQENHLVIDVPGEELPILQALQDEGLLFLFRRLQLHCGREPLYEGGAPATRILDWLREGGFDLLSEDDTQDPDRPCWTLQRNAMQMLNRDLLRQVHTLQEQLEQLIKAKDDADKHAAGLQQKLSQLTRNRDEQAKLAEERRVQIDQLAKAKDEAAKQAADLQQQIAQITKTRDEQAKLATERQSQLDQANKAKAEQTKLAGDRQVQIEKLTKSLDEQVKIATERQAQVQQLAKIQNEQKTVNEGQKAEINKLKAALQEAKNRVAQLEAHLPDTEMRQQLLNEELIKASGQIDLIKDLLLREPGL